MECCCSYTSKSDLVRLMPTMESRNCRCATRTLTSAVAAVVLLLFALPTACHASMFGAIVNPDNNIKLNAHASVTLVPRNTVVSPPDRSSTRVPHSDKQCRLVDACQFFSDVLLVIKLNPTRLLWLDLLLRFYATGFRHIVFFSALKRGDNSTEKYLRIGAHDTVVHLIDDNYGFCDHQTVAKAASWWPRGFSGYLFLSDDVLLHFWRLTTLPKTRVWRQRVKYEPIDRMTPAETRALSELRAAAPAVYQAAFARGFPFAATSGIYFVPNQPATVARFTVASDIFMRHRTYNEWGTPIVLSAASQEPFEVLPGKLVWGKKRFAAIKALSSTNADKVWFHPVRATSEAFSRMTHFVLRASPHLSNRSMVNLTALFSECFACATHRSDLIAKKGLFHSCVRTKESLCFQAPLDTYTAGVARSLHLSALPTTLWVGGRVVVASDSVGIANGLELDHEGFWNKDITDYVFHLWYPKLNRSSVQGGLLQSFPRCCTTPDLQ